MELHPTLPAGIGEEELGTQAPLVRALLVRRLELMWRGLEPFVDPGQGKPDPRFMEAGIRVLDRLARLYRLDAPVSAPDTAHDDDPVTPAELVAHQVAEIEARMRSGAA